jgi:hypothetical protein
MKLIEILNINLFIEQVKSQSLPFKTSYKLAKTAKAIETEVIFYQTKFREIIMQYAEIDENGQPVFIDDGAGIKLKEGLEQECNEKITELQNTEVAFEYTPFTPEEFDNIELSADILELALPLFE